MNVLQIHNLSKNYGQIQALKGLNLSLESGNVYGLLGPNGSGKTTTLGIILGIIHPTAGNYHWFENKYDGNHRRHIGAILETPNFYPYLNAVQNLRIVQRIKNSHSDSVDELLDTVNLLDRKDSPFRTYSLGMKQRLAIAAAMIGNPELLIFDEPTNGLDPQGIAEIRNIILRIAERGKTIFLASHILDEVEKICTHVAILKKGNLLASGSVGSILEADKTFEIEANASEQHIRSTLEQIPEVHQIDKKGKYLLLSVAEDLEADQLNRILFTHNISLRHLRERKRTLEEEFLSITKDQIE